MSLMNDLSRMAQELRIEKDKTNANKLSRKIDKEAQRSSKVEQKNTRKQLLAEEERSLVAKVKVQKVTRFQLASAKEARMKREIQPRVKNNLTKVGKIEENYNKTMAEIEVAASVDEAIDALKSDKNQKITRIEQLEKLEKKAFVKFSERRLPQLRRENPYLRLAQLQETVSKEWKRSGENPLNSASLILPQPSLRFSDDCERDARRSLMQPWSRDDVPA